MLRRPAFAHELVEHERTRPEDAALDAGWVSGAGFDVTTSEPPAPDNPLLRAACRPNVILTPHVAWASDEARQALADQLMDNVEAFVAGQPRNLVSGTY